MGINFDPICGLWDNLPSGKNYASYIDGKGWFVIMHFFLDHKNVFPLLTIIIQRRLPIVSNKAGAERAFLQSGIVMQPARNNIGVTTYQNAVIHKVNMSIIRVPEQFAAKKIFKRKGLGWSKAQLFEIDLVIAHKVEIEEGTIAL